MPNSRNVNNLKINKLTEAQFDEAVAQELIGADEISILTDADAGQVIQYEEMPDASLDNIGQIIQYVGPDYGQVYKNGYFYKCTEYPEPANAYVSDYDGSFVDLSVDPQTFGAAVDYADGSYTFVFDGSDWTLDGTAVNIIDDYGVSFQGTPVQDNSITVEYTSEGQSYDWAQADVGALPDQSGQEGKFLTTDGYTASWNNYIETFPSASNRMGTLINFRATYNGTASTTRLMQAPASTTLYINGSFSASTSNSRDLGTRTTPWRNVFASTISSGSGSAFYIPLGTGWGVISSFFMPTPDASIEGSVLLYVGTTDSTYTHGYAYECKAQGTDPETYAWERIDVQPNTGTLTPDFNSVKFNGLSMLQSRDYYMDVSSQYYLRIGSGASLSGDDLLIRTGSAAQRSIAFGSGNGGAIGSASSKFEYVYVQKINNGANIAVPTTGGTMVVADYTSAQQGDVLTLDSNGDATWAAPTGGGVSSISVTLQGGSANWPSDTQTVTATGVTSSNTVIIGATPTSQAEYTSCGVICTAQGTDSLTFTCTSTPTNDLAVTVLILA